MRTNLVAALALSALLVLPLSAGATPPDHAPAHGYRNKSKSHAPKAPERDTRPRGGIEVVFDSERGIQVAVGLPGVFFHDGLYYRHGASGWEVSVSGDGGWRIRASGEIPGTVREAHRKPHPGPAKRKKK